MSFRRGNFSTRGTVYSKRRGHGGRRKPSTIFEESEEQSDLESLINADEAKSSSSTVSKKLPFLSHHEGHVLKDKSNITRAPRELNDRRTDTELDWESDESHRHRGRRARPKVISTDQSIQEQTSASGPQGVPKSFSSNVAGKSKVKSQE